jgi:hypothetical protein
MEEELPDVFKSKKVWGGTSYGTDQESMQKMAEHVAKQFKISNQESLRMLGPVFGVASAKGQRIFHGRIATDATSGAMRWASEADATVAQAGKLDKIEPTSFYRKDNTAAIFNVTQDGKDQLSDAAIYYMAATQKQLLKSLSEDKFSPKMLDGFQKNIDKLREAVSKGHLDKVTVDAIANATAKKVASAKELAKKTTGVS